MLIKKTIYASSIAFALAVLISCGDSSKPDSSKPDSSKPDAALIDVSTPQSFKITYIKIINAINEYTKSNGIYYSTKIDDFKEDANKASFNEVAKYTLLTGVDSKFIVQGEGQFSTTHSANSTEFKGPYSISLYYQTDEQEDGQKNFLKIDGESSASLSNTGVLSENISFKNLKDIIINDDSEDDNKHYNGYDDFNISLVDFNIDTIMTYNQDYTKIDKASTKVNINDFVVTNKYHGDHDKISIENIVSVSNINYTSDLTHNIFDLLIGKTSISFNNLSYIDPDSNVYGSLDSVIMSSEDKINSDNLYELDFNLLVNAITANIEDQSGQFGEFKYNLSLHGLDAKSMQAAQAAFGDAQMRNFEDTDGDENTALIIFMRSVLTDKTTLSTGIEVTREGTQATFSLSFKPTQALIDLVKSDVKFNFNDLDNIADLSASSTEKYIEKYIDSFSIKLLLPKKYATNMMVEYTKIFFSSNKVNIKDAEAGFELALMLSKTMMPLTFIKYENEIASIDILYKDKVLSINDEKIALEDMLKALDI